MGDSGAQSQQHQDPPAQLVSELFESIKAKSSNKAKKEKEEADARRHEVDFKANLRKVKKPAANIADGETTETDDDDRGPQD